VRALDIYIATHKQLAVGDEGKTRRVNRLAAYPALSPQKHPFIKVKNGDLYIPSRGRAAAKDMVEATREWGGGRRLEDALWYAAMQTRMAHNARVRGDETIRFTFRFRSKKEVAQCITVKHRTSKTKSLEISNSSCTEPKGKQESRTHTL